MEELALLILQIGLGVTFILTGIYIFRSEDKWTGFIQPWAMPFTFGHAKEVMIATALFDITVGIWLISGIFAWVASLLAALHLVQVLIGTGITSTTYRDIGLLAASITLLLFTLPPNIM